MTMGLICKLMNCDYFVAVAPIVAVASAIALLLVVALITAFTMSMLLLLSILLMSMLSPSTLLLLSILLLFCFWLVDAAVLLVLLLLFCCFDAIVLLMPVAILLLLILSFHFISHDASLLLPQLYFENGIPFCVGAVFANIEFSIC